MNGSGKIVSIRSEERAILTLCSQLGITFEVKNTKRISIDFYKTLVLKVNKKPYRQFNVVGINSYSDRQRMSLVVNDVSKGKDNYTLYCKGEDDAMKSLLKFNSVEKNNFKRLIVKMKSAGVKTMIYAKKELPVSVAKSYMDTFALI
jgi:hypothetical protein